MRLSAAIIVKDEAEHLDACLASLRGLVDEIVVVDTGSTDASVEVALRHGAGYDGKAAGRKKVEHPNLATTPTHTNSAQSSPRLVHTTVWRF